uniref:FK506-binding protein 15 n=1 Tax=Polistes dominula TaxID=743375 RepID=A0ABM1IA87_POLDO
MSVDDSLIDIEKIMKTEDEEFTPGGGSNLAAIFGNFHAEDQDKPCVTKQTTQKKSNSKRNKNLTPLSTKTEVIIAKAIHAYKLQNGQYISAGTLGIALTGNISTRTYQIILYKTKYEYVSVVNVKSDFTYTVQANNYSTYYDDNNENWSILFDKEEASIKFARELAIAKYFSKEDKIENVIYQNLTPVNKDEVITKEGSRVTLKYFITTDIVHLFDVNYELFQTMTVNISMDDSWERSLLGISKELKRILFIPSSKQISLGPGFPKDKDVLMEIEVTDIQELEEQFSLTKPIVSGKALLLSRMAKMGQSILPKMQTSTTTDSEDTEDDFPPKKPCHKKIESLEVQKKHTVKEIPPVTHEVAKSKHNVPSANPIVPKPLIPATTFTSSWSNPQLQSNYLTTNGQMYALQPQALTQAVPTVIDPNLNMLLSETRIANAELRMGMSKVADNVQKVLDKFHNLELQNASSTKDTKMEDTLKLLLTMNPLQSNELLKTTDVQKDDCYKGEQLSELSKLKKELFEVENEVRNLKESLTKSTELAKMFEEEKVSLSFINKELDNKINTLDVLLEKYKESQKEYEKENAELKKKVSELNAKLDSAMIETNAVSSKNIDIENRNKEIKYIINKTYHILRATFTDDSYSTEHIKKIIFNTMKNITLQILQEEKNLETESESERDTKNTLKNNQDNNERSNKFSNNPNSVLPVEENVPPPIPPMDNELDNGIY